MCFVTVFRYCMFRYCMFRYCSVSFLFLFRRTAMLIALVRLSSDSTHAPDQMKPHTNEHLPVFCSWGSRRAGRMMSKRSLAHTVQHTRSFHINSRGECLGRERERERVQGECLKRAGLTKLVSREHWRWPNFLTS